MSANNRSGLVREPRDNQIGHNPERSLLAVRILTLTRNAQMMQKRFEFSSIQPDSRDPFLGVSHYARITPIIQKSFIGGMHIGCLAETVFSITVMIIGSPSFL
jgi:hypothetical protein